MTENEALGYLKNSKRQKSMLGILPGSDIGNTIIKALEELKQYRAIGTPEECQAAMEKQIPYKLSRKKLVWGVGKCKCGVEFLDRQTGFCGNCGQKLDWEGER
jgi:membrane protease subunit (stomatin/prohibitin family)